MHPFLASILLSGSLHAVEIVPPSPYMSSEPPAQMDTTEVDPLRRPRCLVVEPGIKEAWYGGWNLTSDQPTTEDLQLRAPRKGQPTVRVGFNDRGWPVEVMYHDAGRNVRWTKLLRYPAKIPSGPGDVPYSVSWISNQGQTINVADVARKFKATTWKVGMTKYQVGDILGEPLMIDVGQGGFAGKPETRTYSIDGKEVRFQFNADNKLTALPEEVAAIAGPKPPAPPAALPKETPKESPKPTPAPVVEKPIAPPAMVPVADTAKKVEPKVAPAETAKPDTAKAAAVVAPPPADTAKVDPKTKCKKGQKCKAPKAPKAPKVAKPTVPAVPKAKRKATAVDTAKKG